MAVGYLGKGTTVTYASTTGGLSGATALANVGSITGPTASSEFLDVTAQNTAGKYRSFIAGVIDPGEITFPLNYDPADAGHQALHALLESQAENQWELDFSVPMGNSAGTNTCVFPGVVTGCEVNAPVDGVITMNVTVKVTGEIDWPGSA